MSAENARWGISLTIRLPKKYFEKAEAEAKEAGKPLSRWARDRIMAELNGENRDALGDMVRNMPRMPLDPVKTLICRTCGYARAIRAKPTFVPDGIPRPEPVFEDPGCPKCEEFAQRYPREAAAAEEAEKRGLTEKERIDTCLTVGTGYGRVVMGEVGKPGEIILGDQMSPEEWARRHPNAVIFVEPNEIPSEASGADGGTEADSVRRISLGYLRDPVTGIGLNYIQEFNPPSRSWSSEWDAMDQMEQGEALARFHELRAGRPLPSGFKGWGRKTRIAWLDREFPL